MGEADRRDPDPLVDSCDPEGLGVGVDGRDLLAGEDPRDVDPTQDTRDRYARLLAYVYKPARTGARGSINYSLVASGHAKV